MPQIPANRLLVKNLTVIGLYFGAWAARPPGGGRAPASRRSSPGTRLGRLQPHVSHVLPLEEANAGLELLRSRAATGKVVVRVG